MSDLLDSENLNKDQKDLINKLIQDDEEGSRKYFDSLSSSEQQVALDILNELAEDGYSTQLSEIYEQDYEETPVDIETFIYDEHYMGKILGDQVYPRWMFHMKQFLDPTKSVIEVCLTGDTKIPLMNGEEKTMKELWEENPDEFFVFSYDFENEENVAGKAHTVKRTRKEKVYKVTLDNGETIKGTADHSLIRRNGEKVEIQDLEKGDSLFPFYRKKSSREAHRSNYKMVYNPNTEEWDWEHYVADEYNQKTGRYKKSDGRIRHHLDFNKHNNSPENIRRVTGPQHEQIHRLYNVLSKELLWSDPEWAEWMRKICAENGRKRLNALWESMPTKEERLDFLQNAFEARDEWLATEEGKKVVIENINVFNNAVENGEDWALEKLQGIIEALHEARYKMWNSDEEKYVKARKQHAESLREHMLNSDQPSEMAKKWWESKEGKEERKRLSKKMKNFNKNNHPNLRDDVTLEKILKLHSQGITSVGDIAEELDCSCTKVNTVIADEYGTVTEFRQEVEGKNNHKVVSVEECGKEWVYNFTVDEHHNYQLSAGVLSANCLTGSIGSGKSTIGFISILFHLHKMLCLRNPQDYYDLMDTDEIVFGVFNATLQLAESVGYQKIANMVKSSPFFKERLIHNPRSPEQINFPKNISIEVGSKFSHALGKHIFAAILDEANFQEDDIDEHKTSQVMKTYNALYRRMESRFLQKGGGFPGQLFLISSKNEQSSFLEVHIDQHKGKDTTYVVDEPIWEFKKHLGIYSGETFRVMIGDQKRDSRILEEGEEAPEDYRVIEVPIEYKESFERDIDSALKDIAGEATYSDVNLIKNRGRVRDCIVHEIPEFGTWYSPFTIDLVVLDFDDDETEIKDFVDEKYFKEYLDHVGYSKPRAIHIDIGVSGDALGFGMAHIAGKRMVEETDLDGQKEQKEREVYRIDMMTRITNLDGKELPLIKVISFVKWLRSLGLNIRVVSTDGYQSTMMRQMLRKQGFETKLVSVDKDDDAYVYLKDSHMDKRIEMYDYEPYLIELFELLHDRKKGKVDHPKKNSDGTHGSKDISDAVCGAVWDLVNDEIQIKESQDRPIDYDAFQSDEGDELTPEEAAFNYAVGDYRNNEKNRKEQEKHSDGNSNFIAF